MGAPDDVVVRPAGPDDLAAVGRLLHDFNLEFEDLTPGPPALATRVRELLECGDTAVLVAGREPMGVAVLRFRLALWSRGLECYIAELYVVPDRRGSGVGRALMEAVLQEARARGADTIELGTEETDVVARRLYESLGFSNRDGGGTGPLMYFYELEL